MTEKGCCFEKFCYSCDRPGWEGSSDGLCKVHDPNNPLGPDEMIEEVQEKVDEGDQEFIGWRFPEETHFKDIEFEDADFRDTVWEGMAIFEDTTFNGTTKFNRARFEGITDFNSDFNGTTEFNSTTFKKAATFDGELGGQLFFYRTTFEDAALFENCIFNCDTLSFRETSFKKYTSFREATFLGNKAEFIDIDFNDLELNFKKTIFKNNETVFNWKKNPKKGIYFQFSVTKNLEFRDINLSDKIYLHNAKDFEKAYIKNSKWETDKKGPIIQEEKDNKLKKAEDSYRQIKKSLNSEGLYNEAGEFYYKEMLMKKKQYLKQKNPKAILYYTYEYLAGYGEKITRVILTWIANITIFALIYLTTIQLNIKTLSTTKQELIPLLKETIYFSAVTFSTLGYGDINPIGIGRYIASIEALTGGALMALFVLVLGRKFLR
ncbi:MAG: Pentapeptide repeat containing protein [Candidatus Methanohalarchaeum thermophilum]|uniref:Pentapeptide repeat containing protein n=1 Tax=Methanohalarchaeum thermophilum TaxID=1903181 RepID=A0A1Q6DT82_METT1|nr:MAG: Pentapeptide repeat containing protein [Candidatus Methanohalarchaeum thermophilum]